MDGGVVICPVKPREALIEERLREARGIADTGLASDEILALTRGEGDDSGDTNVLLDLFTDDETWRSWSERAIRDALFNDSVGINPIIYAEASLGFSEPAVLEQHLDALMLVRLPLPYEAAFPAGRAFLRYRRAGGRRSSPLPISISAPMHRRRGWHCSPGIRAAIEPTFHPCN